MVFSILSLISPIVLWGIKTFFKSEADRRTAAIRFLKYVEARKEFGKKSVKLSQRYDKLMLRLKEEQAKDEKKIETSN